jgi:copper homeostasis protein
VPVLIEVIACSVDDAIQAERGGAGRIELVREPGRGGLTPAFDLVKEVTHAVKIPVRVMVREDDGYEAADAGAVDRLAKIAARLATFRIDGVVIGFLQGRWIDDKAMDAVLAAAAPLRATFHHAFDDLPDPIAGIRELRRWPQIDRVLTSGGSGDWTQKAARIVEWTKAGAGLGMLAGGGVDRRALQILAGAGVAEAHAGRAARVPSTAEGAVSSQQVAGLVETARRYRK